MPAFNEERKISEIIRKVQGLHKDLDILVVNDGSEDNTAQKARETGVKVISHPFNMGYGVAVQTGYKLALREGYDIIVQIDADGQHDPENINRVLNPVLSGEVDYVLGSRFLDKNSYSPELTRRLGMFMFSKIVSWITDKRVYDPTSGYIAFNKKVLEFFCCDSFPNDYPDANMLVEIYYAGFSMKEVSVKMYENEEGKTMHSGMRPVYYVYKMLISIMVAILRKKLGYK